MRYVFSILASVMILTACGNNDKKEALIKQQAVSAVKDSMKLDSFKRAETRQKTEQKQQEVVAARAREERKTHLVSERSQASGSVAGNEVNTPAKKKGWSSAAKGAVIGAGAGALGGILIDKKDGRGAIIGGVVGAGTGYLIGRDKDRKSGRVKPKN